MKVRFQQTYTVSETVEAVVDGDPFTCLAGGEATSFLPLQRVVTDLEIDPDSITVVK